MFFGEPPGACKVPLDALQVLTNAGEGKNSGFYLSPSHGRGARGCSCCVHGLATVR
jgi:hypothetical protein